MSVSAVIVHQGRGSPRERAEGLALASAFFGRKFLLCHKRRADIWLLARGSVNNKRNSKESVVFVNGPYIVEPNG